VVPLDDHNSFYMGVVHLNEYTQKQRGVREDAFGVGKMGLIGQTPDRPYEERQREPGDYDACVSQGAIQNRRNEHLGTTDRGVVLFRRLLAQGIAAVQSGETPILPRLYPENPVRTYCHELVFRLPSQSNVTDIKAVGAFGRRAATVVVGSDGLAPQERETVAAERIRHLLATELVG
jgi:hypothetical protein